jgi:dipeptide/tripeptide permease
VGAACGILNFGGNLGGFFAPILTPYIASRAGWSWGLYAGSLIVMIGAAACYLIDPRRIIEHPVLIVPGILPET